MLMHLQKASRHTLPVRRLLIRPTLLQGRNFGTWYGALTGNLFTLLIFGSVVEGLLSHM